MATRVIMPALGVAQETGKVLRWLKPEGAQVTKGEPLIEIETDKATVEIEAPASGILSTVTAREGDEVPVGQPIAVIGQPGEAAAPVPAAAQAASPSATEPKAAPSTRTAPTPQPASSPAPGGSGASGSSSRLAPASPKARRMARELGVDVASLAGSGPGGAVVAGDVQAGQGFAAAPRTPSGGTAAGSVAGSMDTVTPSAAWRLMAERTTKSWTTAPHFFLVREVSAGRLVGWREAWKRRFKEDVTYTDLLVVLVASALRQHKRLNATWDGGVISVRPEINIGVAVATEEALVVPVIHRADTLRVTEIAARLHDLAGRAQARKLRPEDVRDGTFTVSNLGMYGVDAFTAVLNPPQAAILAVGRIAERVVAVHGAPHVQPMMTLCLSCDHRVVDGARGAQFLQTLADLVEEPLTILGGSGAPPR